MPQTQHVGSVHSELLHKDNLKIKQDVSLANTLVGSSSRKSIGAWEFVKSKASRDGRHLIDAARKRDITKVNKILSNNAENSMLDQEAINKALIKALTNNRLSDD